MKYPDTVRLASRIRALAERFYPCLQCSLRFLPIAGARSQQRFGVIEVLLFERRTEAVRATQVLGAPGGRIAILEFTYPRNACFRALYAAYFRGILPLIGNVVSRSRAYSYLNKSVTAWSSEEELAEMMRTAGCASVTIHPLTLGIAAVHLGVKA